MNKQKLISVLQSRIAKRRSSINNFWEAYYQDNTQGLNLDTFKKVAINTGKVQKEDKQILKQLVMDARHKQHYVEVVYVINKELQVLRRELASYKITGLPYALHHLRGADESKRRVY